MYPLTRVTCLFTSAALAVSAVHAAEPGPLASVLQAAVDKHEVAGTVVLVADKDHVLDIEAAGYSNLSAKTPMKTDALFWIASMTKSFTGAALMMLVDEGKVSLNDPVEKYLPEFKGQMVAEDAIEMHPPKHPITVREIMCHTSGVVTPQDPAFKGKTTLKEIVETVGKLPLRREPGTKFEYNNSGINTGGRIIEVVTGMSYADFMQQRFFTPLELKDTTFFPTEEQASRLARSAAFTADKKGLEDIDHSKGITPQLITKLSEGQNIKVPQPLLENMGGGVISEMVHRYAQPAGGLYSTASDVGRFCQMLLNGGTWHGHRYLSDAAIKTLATSQTEGVSVNPVETYSVGLFVKIRDDEGLAPGSFGHRGARRTVMWVDPVHQLAMVALLQRMDMSGEQQKDFYGSVFRAMVEKWGKKP
ncbi:beta-lactamase [Chthoniobacter flavus Ellin428]|uniref:Beta-lactamase n=1 Tax=Chthoniobacter flavus Ellin428 TaxID=497964 RepID=B4D078_9BACT|nr:serine hydrolase domain-containing protein [Chthoniobacter flavus]EDY20392.1 beta-lactamase [Chthoniobacter flavus Ellin428]TCO94282.1 CubicO group peptidase (beta-lactamase class C family) [Chthoniobacter flavus]